MQNWYKEESNVETVIYLMQKFTWVKGIKFFFAYRENKGGKNA